MSTQLESIDQEELVTVAGGIDWNTVGMQALYGGASGAAIGGTTAVGALPGAIGGAMLGAGLGAWSTSNQPTMH